MFSFIGLGIALTSIAKDQETASMLITTFMFPMMFLSGVFFPVEQMPKFMQIISKFLPLTYAADALRRVMTLGVSLSTVSFDIIILLVFGVVMLGIAVPLFKKMMIRNYYFINKIYKYYFSKHIIFHTGGESAELILKSCWPVLLPCQD